MTDIEFVINDRLYPDVIITNIESNATKGGPGSGNFGHAGRPGEVGGSGPAEGIPVGGVQAGRKSIPEAFHGDEARWKAAIKRYTAGGAFNLQRNIYDLMSKIRDENLYSGELEELYAGPAPWGKGYTEAAYEEYKKRREAAGDKLYFTKDEAQAVLDYMQEQRTERIAGLAKKLGLPDDVRDIVGKDLLSKNPDYRSGFQGNKEVLREVDRRLKPLVFKVEGLVDDTVRDDYRGIQDLYRDKIDNDKSLTDGERKFLTDAVYGCLGQSLADAHEFFSASKLASGEWSLEDARKHGFISGIASGALDDWKELPNDLWHVTTNAAAVKALGIKSRFELNGTESETGLGGGSSMTISYTTDENIAKQIERAVQEAHAVASGKINLHQMIESAKRGGGGVGKPWIGSLPQINPENKGIQDLLDYEDGKDVFYSGKQWTHDDYLRNLWDFYHIPFMNAREYAGGFMNPVFFGTNWRSLAKLDPRQIKTLHFRGKKGARGYQVSSLGEIRSVGNTVDLVDAQDHFSDDINGMLG